MRVASAILAIFIATIVAQTASAKADDINAANAALVNSDPTTFIPTVPQSDLSDIPGSDWAAVKAVNTIADVKERQKAFADLLLPIIRKVNREVLADRQTILGIVAVLEQARTINDGEIADLKRIAAKYDVAPNNVIELLRRADAVPEVLALSQAALESGWGSSDLAKNGLNFFGETRGYGGYAWFDSIEDCVHAYISNLNTHRAYEQFREMRANDDDGLIDSYAIAANLTKYSELGHEYIARARKVMKQADFIIVARQ